MEEKIEQALVFTRTKHGADRLAKQLQRDGITAVPIHGNRSQPQRTKALADFKSGVARILVATDIAARGIDIDQLPHVINFELPNVPSDYVHRIGRTGRAGSPGSALSLVSREEQSYLADIERLIHKRIERRDPVGFTPPPPGSRPAHDPDEREERQFTPRPQRPQGGGGAAADVSLAADARKVRADKAGKARAGARRVDIRRNVKGREAGKSLSSCPHPQGPSGFPGVRGSTLSTSKIASRSHSVATK